MAGAISKADICNLALDHLGQQDSEDPVTNIDAPATQTEVICSRWYDVTRCMLLRKHPWNFALKRAILTPTNTAPLFGYTRAFNLPNDFIRLATLEDSSTLDPYFKTDYQLESNQILLDADESSSMNLRYVSNFEDVTKMDALFIDALAVRMALRMAFKFTASNTDIQRLEQLDRDILQAAKSIDGQERPPIRVERSRALTSRKVLGSNQRTGIRFE